MATNLRVDAYEFDYYPVIGVTPQRRECSGDHKSHSCGRRCYNCPCGNSDAYDCPYKVDG